MNKLLIVEDSKIDRNIIASILEQNMPYCELLFATDPYEARDLVVEHSPQAVLLDLELPYMDGQEFLRCLMKHYPLPVIVTSRLLSLKPLLNDELRSLGVTALVEKPTSYADISRFSDQLCSTLCDALLICPIPSQESTSLCQLDTTFRPSLIAIGASTGGPKALEVVLAHLDEDCPPVVVAQHLSPQFGRSLAERLDQVLRPKVVLAEQDQLLQPGVVYLAPPGKQMRVAINQSIHIEDTTPSQLYSPSIDVLFSSIVKVQPQSTLAIILTGMGDDGASGMRELHRAGSMTIAQDQSTSAIFGMPKKAIEFGGVDHVMPLPAIGSSIANLSKPQVGIAACKRTRKLSSVGSKFAFNL